MEKAIHDPARPDTELSRLQKEVETLRRGLATRTLIGQATGILAVHLNCSTQHAWDVLRKASSTSNIAIREAARLIVEATDGNADRTDSPAAFRLAEALVAAAEALGVDRATFARVARDLTAPVGTAGPAGRNGSNGSNGSNEASDTGQQLDHG